MKRTNFIVFTMIFAVLFGQAGTNRGTQRFSDWYRSSISITGSNNDTLKSQLQQLQDGHGKLLPMQVATDSLRFTSGANIFDGNIGVGVSNLKNWSSGYTALQIGNSSGIWADDDVFNNFLSLTVNAYSNSGEFYIAADKATMYQQILGKHIFKVAAAGANPDDPIAWINALTLENSGNAGIKNPTPNRNFDVNSQVWVGANSSSTDIDGNAVPSQLFVGDASTDNPGVINIVGNRGASNWLGSIQWGTYQKAGTDKRIATMSVYTGPASNSGVMKFYTYNAGTAGLALTLDYNQDAIFNGNVTVAKSDHIDVLFDASSSNDKRAQVQFKNDARQYNVGIKGDDSFVIYDATSMANRLLIDNSGDAIFGGDVTVGGAIIIPPSTLTISTGTITVTSNYHAVDTEASASTDDLETINGSRTGQLLIIHAANTTRTVVVKDGIGNLRLDGDMTLDNDTDTITMIYDGAIWHEISRSDNGT